MFQNRVFFALASRCGFGATISDPVARSSIVFCNSVSADRLGMAASRLLLAFAACVMFFAAGLTLAWLPRAGCALLWTASGFELLSFSSFAFHLALRTAECLCDLLLVYVCVVTNRTNNHDRIAYMWKNKAVVGASYALCSMGWSFVVCWMYDILDHFFFRHETQSSMSFSILALVFLLHVSLEQLDVWGVKCRVWSLSVECEERSVKCEVWGLECEGSSEKCEVWSVDCEVWSVKCEVRSVKFGVWSLQWEGSSEKWEVWSVDCEVWSVKFAVGRKQWEVRSVKCGLWSVECEVRSEKCEVRSVKEAVRSEKCGVWSAKCEVRSAKCEVWTVKCEVCSVKCEVWSVRFGVWGKQWEVRSVECEVWSVKFEVWSAKSAVCSVRCGVSMEGHGRDRVSLNIGYLCLGNFRRRLARVYVIQCHGVDAILRIRQGMLCLGRQ